MTKLSDPSNVKTQHLIDNGWIERKPLSFVKFGIELFFDNSDAVEIYPEDEISRRLADVRISTIADLVNLENDIKNGKYKP